MISKDKIARDKGISAKTLKGKIVNVDFLLLLCLSDLADIYGQFGATSNTDGSSFATWKDGFI